MNITIENKDGITTAYLAGRLDTTASLDATPHFEKLQQAANGTIVIDCSELSYISSSGLRLFISIRKAASAKGGKVIVKNLTNDIRQVFVMTGFLNLFEIQ